MPNAASSTRSEGRSSPRSSHWPNNFKRRFPMDPEETLHVRALHECGWEIRAIARRVGRDVKTIRRALDLPPHPPPSSKLDPFRDRAKDLVEKDLTGPRILRELRAMGFEGGRTILDDYLRTLRGPRKSAQKVFRRFETEKGIEAQVDWSVFRVPIGGQPTAVHCFSMVLAYSRALFVGFYRNEKLPTLLHGHAEAFSYFGGLTRTVVYDNMATVTLGRSGGRPLWNSGFLEFAKHYGFEPKLCRPRDPNRKGKVERPFPWIESDFLRASSFESWDDLGQRARHWLSTVANVRVHSTTRRAVDEMLADEKPYLIALPAVPFPTYRHEVRKVQPDGYVPVDGSLFPAPSLPVGHHATVRVFPSEVEILAADGSVAARHAIPDRPGRLPSPPGTATGVASRAPRGGPELGARFLANFPGERLFLDGLLARMKSLAHVHLRRIEELVSRYGEADVREAVARAAAYGNYNALAVERILQAARPNVVPEAPFALLASPAALGALDDVESGSPKEYTLDSTPPCQEEVADDRAP
jgi:transposase